MMKPFRKNVAVAIDGSRIKGVIATRALSILEEHLGKPCSEIFLLAADTFKGSIISPAIAAKMDSHKSTVFTVCMEKGSLKVDGGTTSGFRQDTDIQIVHSFKHLRSFGRNDNGGCLEL